MSSVASRRAMRRARPPCGEEVAERVRRGREAAGHADAGVGQLADHFAEGGVLAADRLDVGHSQVSNGTTKAVARWVDDMGKLVACEKPVSSDRDGAQNGAAAAGAATAARPAATGDRRWRRWRGAASMRGVGKTARFYEPRGRRDALPIIGDERSSLSTAPSPGAALPSAAPHRVLRLRRHRHHRRDVRQLDPVAVRDQAAPPAAAVHRHPRQGAPGRARDQPHGRARRQRSPIVFVTLVNPEILSIVKAQSQRPRARHVQHLHRAARGRVRHHLEPPHRPLLRRLEEPGIHRPHRGDQLLARARRRPVGEEPAEADVILVGVSRSGKTPTSLYLAMQHGIKAANYPLIPEDFERGRCRRRWRRTRRSASA